MKILKKISSPFYRKFSFQSALPVLVIILVVFLFFWKVFFKGLVPFPGDFVTGVYYPWLDYSSTWGYDAGVPVKNPLTADVPSFIYPMQTTAATFLKTGIAPLWNPYILAGTPLLANFQSAPYSPANLFYFLTDKVTGWTLQIVFQHIAAAVFTYILLRSWKLSCLSSTLGGIIYAFSGFNLIWSQWNGHTLTAGFIPLVLFSQSRFLDTQKARYLIGITVALASQLLSGYPQVVLYTYGAMGIFWITQLQLSKKFLVHTIVLGICVVFSVFITSFQNIPGKELLDLSQRETEPLEYYLAFLPWKSVITFIAPDFFGNPTTRNYWGTQDYTTTTGFVGVVAVMLSIVGIRNLRKRIFVLSLFILSLLLSLPSPLSIYIWKSGFLGLQAASAHRALILFNFAIALMAANGLDTLLEHKKRMFKAAIMFVGLWLAFYTGWAFQINQVVAQRNLVLPLMLFLAAAVLLLVIRKKNTQLIQVLFVLLTIFELFRFGWKFTPFSPREMVFPSTPELDYLMSQKDPFRVTAFGVIPINLRMSYGLESLEGYDAVYPLRIAQFIASLSSNSATATAHGRYGHVDNPNSHLLDLSNVKYYLTLKQDLRGNPDRNGDIPQVFQTEKFEKVFEGPTTVILQSTKVLPRAFMVYDWEVEQSSEKLLTRLLQPDFPINKKILLEENTIAGAEKFEDLTNEVYYNDYSASSSELSVITNSPGLLFISDAWYPGWKAFVNDVSVPLHRANYAFRAIPVPAGTSRVKMIYSPESFTNGIKISVASGVLFGVFILIYVSLKKRTQTGSTIKQ